MNWLRLSVGLLLLVLPGLTLRAGRRMAPSLWAKLTAASLVGGSFLLVTGLLHESMPALFETLVLWELAAICRQVGGHVLAASAPFGWLWSGLAGLLVLITVTRAIGALHAIRCLYAEKSVGYHKSCQDYELVVLPTEERLAFSVPGAPPQVLISESLMRECSEEELEVVVEHEMAHLRYHHGRYLFIVAALVPTLGVLPPVRRSLGILRLALERWADDEVWQDRPAVRETLRTLLVRMAARVQPDMAGFSAADLLVERLRGLDESRSARSSGSWAFSVPLVAAAVACAFLLGTFGLHVVRLFGAL